MRGKQAPRFHDTWELRHEEGYLTNSRPIESVAQLLECADFIWEKVWTCADRANVGTESPWYRGVASVSFRLIPSSYRKTIWKYDTAAADEIRGEFGRRAIPFLNDCRFLSEGELYFVMQHYGLPTRLLDWTEGLLMALFFAIREIKTGEKGFTPCIWMLNPWWLNEKSVNKRNLFYSKFRDEEIESKEVVCPYLRERSLPRHPIAVLPPHMDRRIVAQKSVFTIHGALADGFRDLCSLHKDSQLAKIRLNGDQVETFRDQLFNTGITETSLFPDLEGLAREIRREYDMK